MIDFKVSFWHKDFNIHFYTGPGPGHPGKWQSRQQKLKKQRITRFDKPASSPKSIEMQ